MRAISSYLWIILCLALISGCFEDNAVWLPDSSGFVYVRSDGAVVHYDHGNKKSSIIVQEDWIVTQAGFEKPSISPEGDRVVLVRHSVWNRQQTVQLLIYDLVGKQVQASQEFILPGNGKFSPKPLTYLGRAHWSPDGRHILVTVWAALYENEKPLKAQADSSGKLQKIEIYTTAIYNLQTQSLFVIDKLIECELTALCRISPLVPDGSGFLAQPAHEDAIQQQEDELFLVDWKGRKFPFRFSPTIQSLSEQTPPRTGETSVQPVRGGLSGYGWWQDGTLMVADETGYMTIDSRRRWIDFREDDDVRLIDDYGRREQVYVTPLKVGLLLQNRRKSEKDEIRQHLDLVTRTRHGNEWKWQTKNIAVVDKVDGIVPSPNRKYWLVCCVQDKQPCKLILDSDGTIIADLKDPVPQRPAQADKYLASSQHSANVGATADPRPEDGDSR